MVMTRSAFLCALLFLIAAPGAAAGADVVQTFAAPEVRGVRLDWCKHWGRECGEPAADLFCAEMGFSRAVRFLADPNLGQRNVPTVVFGDGRICEGPSCTGFRAITCVKPGQEAKTPNIKGGQSKDTQGTVVTSPPKQRGGPRMSATVIGPDSTRFAYPMIKGIRLDWCRNWGRACGQPAADLFCVEQGFDKATRFRMDRGIGARGIATVVFGDGRRCEGAKCSGFRHIVCERKARSEAKSQSPGEEVEPPPPLRETQPAPPKRDAGAESKTKPSAPAFVLPETMALLPTARPSRGEQVIAVIPSLPPLIDFADFRPQPPQAVAANWNAILKIVAVYPAGAALYKCGSGDCSVSTSADFEIDPRASFQSVTLNFNVRKVPHSGGARWQVGYLPFPAFVNGGAADMAPPGLLGSGTVKSIEGWFSFEANEVAAGLPPGPAGAVLHVRVLPLAAEGEQVVGQPSNVMRIYYGAKSPPPQPFEFYSTSEVPGSRPDIELTSLVFEPYRHVERWPPGCQTWEEKYGDDDQNILEEIGGFFSDAWNWAGKAYQWAKDRVIDVVGALTFNLIPDSVLAFALDSALASMGIPPNIPNLDQLMKEGIDGLAQEVAKTAVSQVPTADLAANVGNLAADLTVEAAAGMAEQQLRDRLQDELERRSREALLQAADEIGKQTRQAGEGSLCKPTSFHAVFRVGVRNKGNRAWRDLEISADAGPVYRGATWSVDLEPGEAMTLVAVGTPILPNGPYSSPLLYPAQREKEDLARWWTEVLFVKRATIEVLLPGALLCLGGDPSSAFCNKVRELAHRSPPRMVTEPYSLGAR